MRDFLLAGYACVAKYKAKRELNHFHRAETASQAMSFTQILAQLRTAQAVADGVARGDIEVFADAGGREWYKMTQLVEVKGAQKDKKLAADAPGNFIHGLEIEHEAQPVVALPSALVSALALEGQARETPTRTEAVPIAAPPAAELAQPLRPLALTDASATQKAQMKLGSLSNQCQSALQKAKLVQAAFGEAATLSRAQQTSKSLLEEAVEALAGPTAHITSRAEKWMAPLAANYMTQADCDADIGSAQVATKLLGELSESYNMAQVSLKKK